MDRLAGIDAFVAVAGAGGFSAAARATGTPIATLSRRVADLEADLGTRLLRRSTREVVVTDAGQAYLATCRRVLDDLRDADDAVRGAQRSPRGELQLTAPVAFGRLHVQPVAHEFLSIYPEVTLRLLLVDRVVSLVDEHVDLAVRIAELPDGNLVARSLGSAHVVVCASPAYLAARGTPAHPDELVRHDCIVWSGLGSRDSWWFRVDGVERQRPVRTRLATTTAESALDAACAGLGLVQTTAYQAHDALRDGRLVLVLHDYACEPLPASLVYPRERLLPLKVRAFIDFAAPRLAQRLAGVAATMRAAAGGAA